jgi:peptidoglycan/xylan/chitin deacetylase (PgdA/CDA1 family)
MNYATMRSTAILRVDATATIYFFHPLKRWLSSSKGRIPILMYHSVSNTGDDQKHPYYQTVTAPDVFARQMQLLHENGYRVLDLGEALVQMQASRDTSTRAAVITFDDGFRDFYRNAFPILDRFGFSATMFLPTAFVGGKSARDFKGRECLTWEEVRALRRAGVQFGSHTVTHPQLQSVEVDNIRHELRASKQAIEDELGETVKSFAYPYAFPEGDWVFRRTLRRTLEETGYEHGVSTIIGTADHLDDRFFMKRVPVNSYDNPRLFLAKLEGGYDWLHCVQYASKLIPMSPWRDAKFRGSSSIV